MTLVTVAKDGNYLDVHPDTLEEHQKLGWKACERQAIEAEETTAPTDEAPEAPKRRGRPPKKAE